MISIDEYENIVALNFFAIKDNNVESYNLRKKLMDEKYDQEYLKKIIRDTYKIVDEIIDNKLYEEDTVRFLMNGHNIEYINLNLTGGWASDQLAILADNSIVSFSILRHVFGKYIEIMIDLEDTYDATNYKNGCQKRKYYLRLERFPLKFDYLKEKKLMKSLKE